MTRLMGIDYGAKRIGIALSDEAGCLAFPYLVIKAESKNIFKEIGEICRMKGVEKIILGKSLDYAGRPNPVMEKIEKFKVSLEEKIKLPVEYQVETLTTKEAERIQGKNEKIDASAAALILRSFIEKEKMIK